MPEIGSRSATPVEGLTFELGTMNRFRLRATTRVRPRLSPCSPAVVVTKLQQELTLEGTADNLDREVRASLIWLIQMGSEVRRVQHTAGVVLVPAGDKGGQLAAVPFEVRELRPSAPGAKEEPKPAPLTCDVLTLGLTGQGQIGFCIEPEDGATEPCELAAGEAGASFDVPVSATVVAPDGRTPLDPATILVGRKLALRIEAGAPFANREAELHVWESETSPTSYEDELAMGGYKTTFTMGSEPHVEVLRLGVDGGRLWYSIGETAKLRFRYRVRALGDDHLPVPGSQPICAGLVAEVEPPRLTKWTIARQEPAAPAPDAPSDGALHAAVAGQVTQIASDFGLTFDVALYLQEPEPVGIRPLDIGCSVQLNQGAPAATEPGTFSGSLTIGGEEAGYLRDHAHAAVFATIAFPPGPNAKEPFGSFIAYTANMAQALQPDGFAPFVAGGLATPDTGRAVCTQLLSYGGDLAALASSAVHVPEAKKKEFHLMVAAIWGEACGQSEVAWRALAHLIMNRAANKHRGQDTVEGIVLHTGFDATRPRSNPADPWLFGAALAHLEKKTPLERPDQALRLERMAKVVARVYLGLDPDMTSGADHYYSPKAQAKLHAKNPQKHQQVPTFALEYQRVAVAILPTDDFVFFRSQR
ncbi:MAG: cell wall hydrolase [Myxococcales bacterium]|nr:cell wall hydrolase [Myxococcales bacterium]